MRRWECVVVKTGHICWKCFVYGENMWWRGLRQWVWKWFIFAGNGLCMVKIGGGGVHGRENGLKMEKTSRSKVNDAAGKLLGPGEAKSRKVVFKIASLMELEGLRCSLEWAAPRPPCAHQPVNKCLFVLHTRLRELSDSGRKSLKIH